MTERDKARNTAIYRGVRNNYRTGAEAAGY